MALSLSLGMTLANTIPLGLHVHNNKNRNHSFYLYMHIYIFLIALLFFNMPAMIPFRRRHSLCISRTDTRHQGLAIPVSLGRYSYTCACTYSFHFFTFFSSGLEDVGSWSGTQQGGTLVSHREDCRFGF